MFMSRGTNYAQKGAKNSSPRKVPLKGLFSDGIWQCNCDPRLPAQRFQTKNGGKNHGRWFYTCQKPQPTRCDFFLWEEEAKPREAAVVLNNGHPVSLQESLQTPTKPSNHIAYLTPETGGRLKPDHYVDKAPYTPSKVLNHTPRLSTRDSAQEATGSPTQEFYDWPASDDEDVSRAADKAATSKVMLPPETPRRDRNAETSLTPGKRKIEEMLGESFGLATPLSSSTIKGDGGDFSTQSSVVKDSSSLFSPFLDTPNPVRFKDGIAQSGEAAQMSDDILGILRKGNVTLSPHTTEDVVAFCRKQMLYTQGLVKGRDLSRKGIQKKQEKITELQSIIEGLQNERESTRAVIRHLREQLGVIEGNNTL